MVGKLTVQLPQELIFTSPADRFRLHFLELLKLGLFQTFDPKIFFPARRRRSYDDDDDDDDDVDDEEEGEVFWRSGLVAVRSIGP